MRHTYLLLPDLKYSLNLFFVIALIEAFQIFYKLFNAINS